MAITGGMSCVKYLFFCFNLLFALTGLAILIVGVKALIDSSRYIDPTDVNFYMSAPIVLIIVGIIAFIVPFFGCCGAVKENHCMIVTFSVFLLIIFVAEVAVGIAGYVNHQDLETAVMEQLNNSMKSYPADLEIQKTFNIMQTDLHCCGVNGPADWAKINQTMPTSCCNGSEIGPNGEVISDCDIDSKNLYKTGCYTALLGFFKSNALELGGIVLGVAFVQLLGVIFACCLARSIRNQYETV